ncbi:MAG: glycoside hydrolase family 127 protein [Gammaproteobacteria bacterium]|nr:glycoside hydrolase family 127 protein [Gammaproteobacteria bacterium]
MSGDVVRVRPFPLQQVRLRPGLVATQLEINQRHLLGQDPDRLLHMFRVTAGLPSIAEPLGGWEAPDSELRGHFAGHYLSACALMHASTGNEDFKSRSELMVRELGRCQDAIGSGYLSAFPVELFYRLRSFKRVWCPFYTLHKIMAGLLDVYRLTGNAQALEVLRKQADWLLLWLRDVGEDHMNAMLELEHGGMNEVLYNLYAVTGSEAHRDLARRFDHERFFGPLAVGRDELSGLHANCQIPKVIGAARRHELLHDRRARDVVDYFWHQVTGKHSYCTGGTSNKEHWGKPGELSGELSGYTQECCVTYNMLRLSRHLFGWNADPAVADYYERAYFNGILGTMHPADGSKLYYVSLSSGLWKMFGTPGHDYWCCTGSMAESFAKLGDSVYFRDDDGIYVNLFIASELDDPGTGLRLIQETNFPEEEGTRFTLRLREPRRLALRIRVPAWSKGGQATLNGRLIEGFAEPGGYFRVQRIWRDGDRIEVALPMSLHVHRMRDDATVQAIMYGPLVLAGRLGTAGLTSDKIRASPARPFKPPEYTLDALAAPSLTVPSDDPSTWIERVPGRSLAFRTRNLKQNVSFAPLYQVIDERYATYWKVTGAGDGT